MKIAIEAEKDSLQINRYLERKRISQAIKIICDPWKLNQIYRDLIREPERETLYDVGKIEELYYGTIIQYSDQYKWKLEDRNPPPKKTWMYETFPNGTE